MKRNARLIAVLLLFIPLTCNAGWIYNLSPGTIRAIGDAGDVTFGPLNTSVMTGCQLADFYIITSANNAKMALSILLTAKALGKQVNIYVDDAAPLCSVYNRPLFTHIMLAD